MGGVLRGATVGAIGETFWRHEGGDGARTDVYEDASDGGSANGEIDDKDTGVAGGECGTAHIGARGVVDVSRGAIKPITFGGKLYLSYKFVMWTKERKKGKTASASMAMATKTTHRRQRGRREKAPVLVSA